MAAGKGPLLLGACLSLTGRYSRFGLQAARALEVWRGLDGEAELIVEDDCSDPTRLTERLAGLARRCDLLLGPYSTQLTRAAARVVPELDRLLWNHGGAGDDVEGACPGRLVSVLAPASRYAVPFVEHVADSPTRAPLWILQGKGTFGRQVAGGAEAAGRRFGLETVRLAPKTSFRDDERPAVWDLFSVGAFEDDVAVVAKTLTSSRPPREVCSVAAGVREFAHAVTHPEGIYGIAQWFQGSGGIAELGPPEDMFIERYTRLAGAMPDYPAVQALAGAVIAAHCARAAGDLNVEALWQAAVGLDTTTVFGPFRIDSQTGIQVAHQTTLVRWSAEGLTAVR